MTVLAIPPVYEGTGYRRIILDDGTEMPGAMAFELPPELTAITEAETPTRPARTRIAFTGTPTGSVPVTFVLGATAPILLNGGVSADFTAPITVSIAPATISTSGSLSAADKTKLDSMMAGAAIADVVGSDPIVVTGVGTKNVAISAASASNPGSMSSAHYTRVEHILDPVAPTTIVPDAAASAGAATTAALADHTHAIAAAVAGPIQVGGVADEGIATSFSRSDHRHSFAAPAAPTVIVPDATAAAGSAAEAARADHTHGIVAAIAGAILIGDAAAEGVSTAFARADHTHSHAAPATPASVGAANSAGAATAAARADHVHAHAYQQYMGANTLTGTTTVRYLSVGFNTGTASANILDMTVTKAFKIDSLAMIARVGGTAGQTISATIRKNGAAVGTAVLTTASDAFTGNTTFSAVSFAVNDTWGIEISKSGAIASSPTDITWTVGMTPP